MIWASSYHTDFSLIIFSNHININLPLCKLFGGRRPKWMGFVSMANCVPHVNKMATYLIAVLVVAALINYSLALGHLAKYTADEHKKFWPNCLRLLLTVGVTLILFTYSCIAYFLWILPTFHRVFSLEGLFHALLFLYIWINIVFNYFAAVLTSPGKAYTINELEEEGYSTKEITICKKCNRLKNMGTGHCVVCGYCVRLISHHSYMLNNCIGLNNYSYYYLFLFYSCLGELYAIHELYRPFKICLLHSGNKEALTHCHDFGDIAVLFVLLMVALILTGSKLLAHSTLLCVDKSQTEFSSELKSSSSTCRFLSQFFFSIFRRRLSRHRLKHLISERKPQWRDILLPSLHEPPIDLAAEDYIDYEDEAQYMIWHSNCLW